MPAIFGQFPANFRFSGALFTAMAPQKSMPGILLQIWVKPPIMTGGKLNGNEPGKTRKTRSEKITSLSPCPFPGLEVSSLIPETWKHISKTAPGGFW